MVSIAFTGGGSGGHLYPGLAIVSRLKNLLPCRIFWIGSNAGMDRAVIENAGIEFYGVPSGKLRRHFSLRNVSDAFRVGAGFLSARKILKRERPVLLFSKGGFVSVPPCAAAASLKIPVFTHESDYSPGLATRINTRFAERIFIPYRETAAFFSEKNRGKIMVSGNPIRTEFDGADPEKGRAFLGLNGSERVLLVLGGSQGSREINELIRPALPELTKFYTVVHQTGESHLESVSEGVSEFVNAGKYKPFAYFKDEIPHVIATAELILCRCGANTLFECKYLNKPMVLIPFRGSGTRGDQVENARIFQEAGAAIIFSNDSSPSSPEALSHLIASLASDPEKRNAMGEAKITEQSAAKMIANEILNKVLEKNDGSASSN